MDKPIKVNTKTKLDNFMDVQKAFQELQKNFNLLVDRIVSPAEKELKETEGNTGEIQIAMRADKTYTFEVRTDEGWKTPGIGGVPVTFDSKPKSLSSDKIVLPRPDYDSGWVIWNWSDAQLLEDSALVLTHNLGVLPYECRVWFAPDGSLNQGTAMPAGRNNPTISGSHGDSVSSDIIKWAIPIPATFGSDHDFGIGVGIEIDQVSIIGGTGGTLGSISVKSAAFNGSGDFANYVDGYIRILLWK